MLRPDLIGHWFQLYLKYVIQKEAYMKKEEKNSNKCPICGRSTHKESKYCIFHASAKEKTVEEFKEALKKHVTKINKGDGDYDFKEFIFVGNINFKKDLNVAILKNSNFKGATFKGYAKFGKVTFETVAGFSEVTFETDSDFSEATFKKYVDFEEITFKGYADFRKVTFEKDVDFSGATFKEYSNFREATFKGNAGFWWVTFEEYTNFGEVTFEKDADFIEVTFEKDSDFRLKYLVKILNFSKIKAFSGKKLFIRINNEEGEISFERAYLENVYLNLELKEKVLIDFYDALVRNTKMERDQIENHILQEKKKEFSQAKKIYLLLKNNFDSIGQYEDESWAFAKERDMERMSKSFYLLLNKYKNNSLFKKILKQSNLLKRIIIKSKIFSKWLFSKKAITWFNLSFSDFIYRYGENPWRVIRFASITIFLFAIILNISGIVNSDRTNLIIEFIKESQGDEYTLKYLGPILGNFLNCLYFSVVTFTTLGYGDFQPAAGLSRFFVSLESLIGAITMALFVYTFARRTGGR